MTTDDTQHDDARRDETRRDERVDWSQLGRAAEDFARQVARDAARFAEKIEEHARDLARDVGREWRRSERRHRRHAHQDGSEEMRRVFADVRTLVDDVLDGVDDILGRFFPDRGEAAHQPPSPPTPPEPPRTPSPPEPPARGETRPWTAVVANRSGVCSACGSGIPVGAESFVRVADGEPEFRCSACGASH